MSNLANRLTNVTWIVQDNLGSTSSTAESIRLACLEEGCEYSPVQVIPFSYELPEMPRIDNPFVMYGRTSMILGAHKDEFWKRGVFFNPDTFSPAEYVKNFGSLMLNFDMRVIRLGDVIDLDYQDEQVLFVRPNDDLKMFVGGTITYAQLLDMSNNSTDNQEEPINIHSEIVVSSAKEIDREWRLFIVCGKVATGSQYLPGVTGFVPPEVIAFAESAAKIWTPHDVFVMDIAAVNGELKIIECNCFNGSGFYLSDLNLLIRAASKYQESVWDD